MRRPQTRNNVKHEARPEALHDEGGMRPSSLPHCRQKGEDAPNAEVVDDFKNGLSIFAAPILPLPFSWSFLETL